MQLSFAQGVNWISVFKLLKYTYTFIRTLKSCMQPFKVGAIWKQAEINANIIETVSNWSRVAIMETENLNCLRRILHSYVEFWVQSIWTNNSYSIQGCEQRRSSIPPISLSGNPRAGHVTSSCFAQSIRSNMRKGTWVSWIPAHSLRELTVVLTRQGINSGSRCGPYSVFLTHANSSVEGPKEFATELLLLLFLVYKLKT